MKIDIAKKTRTKTSIDSNQENERKKGGEGKDRESYIYLYVNSLVYKQFLSHYKLNLKPNELQYDLQDDLGGQSHKSKMILELLVQHLQQQRYLYTFS